MPIKRRQQQERCSQKSVVSTLLTWRSSSRNNSKNSKQIGTVRAFSVAILFCTIMIILQHSKLRGGIPQQQQQQQQQQAASGSTRITGTFSSIAINNIDPKADAGPQILKSPQDSGYTTISSDTGSIIHHHQHYYSDQNILVDLSNTNGIEARAFPFPNMTSFPCFLSNEKWTSQQPTKRGFLFLKPYKTASSTAAGIHLRIAKHVAQQRQFLQTNDHALLDKHNVDDHHPPLCCESRFDHGNAHQLFPQRDKNQSFLWSIVRDPQSRLISLFYHFWVSRYGHKATTANFIDFVRRDLWQSQEHYLKVLSTQEPFQKYVARLASGREGVNATRPTMTIAKSAYVNQILLDYDFLAITERLDESAVVLAMLLDLPLGDILHLSAKGQGGYDDGGFHSQCTRIQKTIITPGMREFFETKEWADIVYWDDVFYRMANQSLDKTIDETLGRTRFELQLQTFRSVLSVAQTRCLKTAVFPCSPNGTRIPDDQTDCIWRDSGCGYHCLNQVASEFGILEHASSYT